MDPKTARSLDPKLKEAYDRVMGTLTTSHAATTSPLPSPPPPPLPPPADTQLSKPPFPSLGMPPVQAAQSVAPHSPQQIAEPTIQPQPVQPQAAKPTTSAASSGTTFVAQAHKGKSGVHPAFVATGVVVFFLAYTFFWIKFFNLPLPFIP
ncbi:MAG: hypothetical protein HY429_04595 [Candidatus Levybacteria bacterium]|nr:hypothetical protein [Candidatus Levybacteria bacterium]